MKFAKQVTGRNVDWGTGKERGSFTGRLIIDNIRYSVFSVYTTGEITLNFGWNYYRFGEKKAIHLKNIVNEKLSLSLEDNIWMKGYPLLDLKNYIDNDGDDLKALIEKFVDEMKSHKPE